MNPSRLPLPPAVELTCGTCPHWHKQPQQQRDLMNLGTTPSETGLCRAVPPTTSFLLAGNPPQPVPISAYPNLPVNWPACAIHPRMSRKVIDNE